MRVQNLTEKGVSLQNFLQVSNMGSGYSNQFPIRKKEKPKTGSLYYKGRLIKENLPFPLLQEEKKKLLEYGGYVKKYFEIHYYYGKT